MSNNQIMAGYAYRASLMAKSLTPQHHKKAAGGYRDYTTNPVRTNEVKAIQINRAVSTSGRTDARTTSSTGTRSDSTRDLSGVDKNEQGTLTANLQGIMIVGGILAAAGLIYYYYR